MTTAPSDPGPRATLVRWLRPDGSAVAVDDSICELETDKTTVDLAAWADGVLWHLAQAGDPVSPGDEVARIEPRPPPAPRPQ